MTYFFKYKRRKMFSLSKKVKVMGHNYDPKENRMDLFLGKSKGIISIGKWDECDITLGPDFMLFQKENIEKNAGQNVKVEGV